MSLNIKNERVHALAREAARVTGKTQTGAIEEALEQLLASRAQGEVQASELKTARITAAVERWRETASDRVDWSFDAEDLYDSETGLPA